MPCADPDHEHDWPVEDAELEIENCERFCDYCNGKPNKRDKAYRDAAALRRHVYTDHINPAAKRNLPASHDTITIKDYDGAEVERGRADSKTRAAKKKREESGPRSPRRPRAKGRAGAKMAFQDNISTKPAAKRRKLTLKGPRAPAYTTRSSSRVREALQSDAETDGGETDIGDGEESGGEVTAVAATAADTLQLNGRGRKKSRSPAPEGGRLKRGPEDFTLLTDAAFAREKKRNEVALELSRVKQEELRAVEKQLRMEEEEERRGRTRKR